MPASAPVAHPAAGRRLFAFLCLLAMRPGLAAAANPPVLTQLSVAGSRLPVYEIASVESRPGDSLEDFVARLSLSIHDWTGRHGHEACAQICRSGDGGRFAARVVTLRSHTACPLLDTCPNGWLPTRAHLHSHSQLSRYRPNAADRAFVSTTARRLGLAWNRYPDRYSEADRALAPGYLVGRRALHLPDRRHAIALGDLRRRYGDITPLDALPAGTAPPGGTGQPAAQLAAR